MTVTFQWQDGRCFVATNDLMLWMLQFANEVEAQGQKESAATIKFLSIALEGMIVDAERKRASV